MTAVQHAPAAARPAASTSVRPHRVWLLLLACLAVLAGLSLASLVLGNRDLAIGELFTALTDRQAGDVEHDILWDQRLPRTLVALAVGAALGLAGAVMQGITRNPLADPGLLGVNAGAAIAVTGAITVLGITSPLRYIWFALAGAALAAALVYGVGALGREGATPVKLALAGTAVTAGATSFITLMLLTDRTTLDAYRRWAVGSLAGRGTDPLVDLAPFLVLGVVLALLTGRTLNLLAMGDDVARGLGQNLPLARAATGTAVVLLAGGATALAGPIVFVGLVVPHLARALLGLDYRLILPFSLLLGPVLIVAADVIGRLVVRPGELEAGIVVAVVGAPVLVAIVRRVKLAGL
ncbi:FecCD family ABC transporter permease [Georgenia alba]|uniref:FecCD family ABC transporter permease n=1 Tax=Georgenia alba TaxID=2233858 RepID=A0ABW2QDC6_9MICO